MLVLSVITCILISICISSVTADYFKPELPCVPTAAAQGPCHECVCGVDGVFQCREKTCQYTDASNATRTLHGSDLPEIKEGDTCEPGKVYNMDCNTCKCTDAGALMCTKMACIKDIEEYMKHFSINHDYAEEPGLRTKKEGYPKLPKGKCTPGKIYSKGCQKCFCDNRKKAKCTNNKDSCKALKTSKIPETPEDVRPPFTAKEVQNLPTLATSSAKCDTGKAYKVDCNTCLCLHNRSLFCSKLLCLSPEDMFRVEAEKKSGRPCKSDDEFKTSNCVKCVCVKKKSKCQVKKDCVEEERRTFHGAIEKYKPMQVLSLYTKEKCMPDTIYKNDCNKCYCQRDGSLRCTQKTCLRYAEALKLKRHRLYLEKHGL